MNEWLGLKMEEMGATASVWVGGQLVTKWKDEPSAWIAAWLMVVCGLNTDGPELISGSHVVIGELRSHN